MFSVLISAFDSWVNGRWEVIFVDGGSTDRTASLIAGQNATDHVSSRYGRPGTLAIQAAVSTGLAFGVGRFIGVIDADLQDPIDVLRTMYEVLPVRRLSCLRKGFAEAANQSKVSNAHAATLRFSKRENAAIEA